MINPNSLFNHYIPFVNSCWIKNDDAVVDVAHCVLGLSGETGEVAELFKKLFRGDTDPEFTNKLIKELGDVIYYWTKLCDLYEIPPELVIQQNIEKLTKRKENNTIQGSGDDR